jgi:HNH endonuclease
MSTNAPPNLIANAPQAIRGRLSLSDLKRFLRKVRPARDSDCWLWTGHRDEKGYGQFRLKTRAFWAHRLSYATFVGPIPDGMTVHHKKCCLNPRCVNPDHLELLTIEDNTAEGNERRFLED